MTRRFLKFNFADGTSNQIELKKVTSLKIPIEKGRLCLHIDKIEENGYLLVVNENFWDVEKQKLISIERTGFSLKLKFSDGSSNKIELKNITSLLAPREEMKLCFHLDKKSDGYLLLVNEGFWALREQKPMNIEVVREN